uniref:M superfamily MMSK group conopeptide Vt3-KP04 n=1 Tax=Conus planorbis TaxID=97183 RepID=H2BKE8_CONPO|nr:M superfamily MMSK group conopeptide Vt3-KP04 [Conus planorbis]
MMSKLGVLLTICLLLFPHTAVPLDGDQPADQPAERLQDDVSSEHHPMFNSIRRREQNQFKSFTSVKLLDSRGERCCGPTACLAGCKPCCG